MLRTLILAVTYIFEMLVAYVFFIQQGDLKFKKRTGLAIGTGIFLSGLLVYSLFPTVAWLNGLYFIVINFLFGFLVFDIRWSRVLFSSVVLDVLSTALEFAAISSLAFLTAKDMEYHLQANNTAYFAILMCISKLLYFLCSIPMARLIQREKTRVRFPKVYYIYPFAVISVLLLVWHLYASVEIPGYYLIFFSLICVFLLLSVILLFSSYQATVQTENTIRILQSQAEKNETERRYYSILEKQNERLRMYAHDAKKHLNAIRALNQDAQIDAYINQMSAHLRAYSQVGDSGNRMLDIIFSKYTAECENRHIELHWNFRAANLAYVEDFDLVTILGNLLDNAVEAAGSSQKREIFVRTTQKNDYDILIVENSCDAPPQVQNKMLVTTKVNRELHGLGLKSVSEVLKKYGGDYNWHYDKEKKQFCLTAMLTQPQA
ncbi:MAG: GHKL domain-containing protein [Lachnospiraceae bacterium]